METGDRRAVDGGAGAISRYRRFYALDGLRGVAAFIVVLFHAWPFFGRIAPGGYLAVDVFFALSGFVLAHRYETDFRLA